MNREDKFIELAKKDADKIESIRGGPYFFWGWDSSLW